MVAGIFDVIVVIRRTATWRGAVAVAVELS